MCGITGYLNINSEPIKNTSRILSMLKVQKHRGPDDSGIRAFSFRSGESVELEVNDICEIKSFFEGVLGFNRLSILDLSSNGHQPMVSPDNKVILALNGEIYNAFDYKKELEVWGYRFKSTTDTEIVLALYLKYGFEGMLMRLNGMFAIVIADMVKGELFVTRDRYGIKPLYYLSNSIIFAFSSELKSFRYLEKFRYTLQEDQLDEYLLFRNNLNGTLFNGIESLTPGHYISFKHDRGVIIKRFFDINNYNRCVKREHHLKYYKEKLEDSLSKSVRSQLMSDVKLGCQLSGGIDSSLVTLLANRSSESGNFEAVSIVFNDPRFTEEKYINSVAEKLGIVSHKFLLDSDYYSDNIENATWHFEAPINHPNTVAIYKLSQDAKKYVTVLLSGEGADEVFGGYGRFYDIEFPYRLRLLLHEVKKNLSDPLSLAGYFNAGTRAIIATSFMTPAVAKRLWSGFRMDRATESRRSMYNALSGSLFDCQVKYEINSYLPDLLVRQDKMSMAHSIENRVPFLDNEVVENSFTIPEEYLLIRKSPEGLNTAKYLLKKMTAATFGNDFAFRDKMGFSIPLREFFMNKKSSEYIYDKILPGIKKRGLFNCNLTSSWFSKLNILPHHELEALWVAISFEIWASIYLDQANDDRNT